MICLFTALCSTWAQYSDYDDGFTVTDNTFNPNRALDSLDSKHKEVPKGMKLWTIDGNFGDREEAEPDTAQHLFMNSIFTTGMYGEYNTTGNLGSPRLNRIATDRDFNPLFVFLGNYDYFLTDLSDLKFTNTLSPITNLTFNTCGNRTNGEDHLKALFATNVNKKIGFGFKFDYVYGRGYYQNQSTALFDYTMWGSYLGDNYQAHLAVSFDHLKVSENGGITDDSYITHPEAINENYSENEIPVQLSDNWNRNDAFHVLFSHRYNIGFYRDVPMDEQEKEAHRFALRAEKEKKELEKARVKAALGAKTATREKSLGGRPDDAVIVGDLPTDSIREKVKQIAEQQKLHNDSLLALRDTMSTDTSWVKKEYVPVTSFIHTLSIDNFDRSYIAYKSPADYYKYEFDIPNAKAPGDSIYDQTKYFCMRNVFAVSLLEGFNKYVPMGAKLFMAHELYRFGLPVSDRSGLYTATDNNLSIGGQLIRSTSNKLRFNLLGEFYVMGCNVGDILLDADAGMGFKAFKRDSVEVALKASYHLTEINDYFCQYHSKHFAWDNDDFSKVMHTRLEGSFSLSRTHTSLRVAYDNFQNLAYLGVSYDRSATGTVTNYSAEVRQTSKNISLFTVDLQQNFKVGILNWENRITFQKSSDEDILPVPALNVWSNLYLNFRIAKVLRVHFGADVRYFTEYNAPEYVPQLSQYAVQENESVRTKVGNYPIVNVYCNFRLKQCRFFVMMSHVNAGSGSLNYFLTPHHPLNERVLRLGLNWTFFN